MIVQDSNSADEENRHPYSELPNCDTNDATHIEWFELSGKETFEADHKPINKRSYFQYLDRLNNGFQNGRKWQNKSYETYQLNRRLVDSMKYDVRLDPCDYKQAVRLLDGLQRSNMGIDARVVAVCTFAYIIHNNDSKRDCHPQVDPDDRDYYIEDVRQERDIPEDQFNTVYNRVASKIRQGDLEYQTHDRYETDPASEQSWDIQTGSDEEESNPF